MQTEQDALELLQHTMADIYVGRTFSFEGRRVAATQAFAPNGFLPFFAAMASRRFRMVHPDGLVLDRCMRCGGATPPAKEACPAPCPLRAGERVVDGIFDFELAPEDPGYLIPVRVRLPPYRSHLFFALFHTFDAAQDMLLSSPSQRIIPIDRLADELAAVLQPDLEIAVELMQGDGAPAPGAGPDVRTSRHG